MKKTIKVGIIGLGNIGYRYTLDPLRTWVSSHLEAYRQDSEFECVAFCDRDTARLQEAKRFYPSADPFTDWRLMLTRQPSLDLLTICVSPELNYEFCLSSFPSYPKVVVFEKPFCENPELGHLMR